MISRKPNHEKEKTECMLDCGHVIVRSISNQSDRCYCSECPITETSKDRANRLNRERRARRKKIRRGLIP